MENFIDNYNLAAAMTTPKTVFVPGHGQLADRGDLMYVRDAVSTIHDRFRKMVGEGMTLEQIRKARPTREWDERLATEICCSKNDRQTSTRFYEQVYDEAVAHANGKMGTVPPDGDGCRCCNRSPSVTPHGREINTDRHSYQQAHMNRIALIALAALAAAPIVSGQQSISTISLEPPPPPLVVDGIEVLKVQGQVYMLAGDGPNIAVQIGDEGVLVVDSGKPAYSRKILAAIRALTIKPIRNLVNTSGDVDRVAGNELIVQTGGVRMLTGQVGGGNPADRTSG